MRGGPRQWCQEQARALQGGSVLGRAREAAGGAGSGARLCAEGGGRTARGHPPARPRIPLLPHTRRPFSSAAAERGRRGGGGHPRGDPSPSPSLLAPPHPRERRAGADPTRCTARPCSAPSPPPCGLHASTAPSPAGPRCPSRALCGAPAPASDSAFRPRRRQPPPPLRTLVSGGHDAPRAQGP